MFFDEIERLATELKDLTYFSEVDVRNEQDRKDGLKLKIADLRTKSSQLFKVVKENSEKLRLVERLLVPKDSYLDPPYLAGSPISAKNKAHEVLKRLAKMKLDTRNYAFVSLGGGDGTELYAEIENSSSNYGLLLEYDFNSVNKFSNNYLPFRMNHSRGSEIKLDVIECDLFDKDKLNVAKKLISAKNLSGIIITIHAVLHELSTRSSLKEGFMNENGVIDWERFFRELYEWHENIILFIREPGIAENWKPKQPVYITISNEYLNRFLNILGDIDRSHFEGNRKSNFEYLEKQKQIQCIPELAIEALTKLFYYPDYKWERREKVTSLSRENIVTALQAGGILFKILESEPFYTGSLDINMEHFGVSVTGNLNYPLPKPQCFTYTIATKETHSTKQ